MRDFQKLIININNKYRKEKYNNKSNAIFFALIIYT